MSTPKKQSEQAQTFKTRGASASEALSAALLLTQIATNPEAGPEVRAMATTLQRELEAPPTQADAARRSEVMSALASFAARNV